MYTILVCDDDKDIVSALDIYLTSEGYRTVKAYDGLEALQAAESQPVDLILMDIMMPGLDGIRVIARVKSQLRRYTSLGGKSGSGDSGKLLTNGGIALDDSAKSVTVDGDQVNLTPLEYNILLLLLKNPGRVFSTSQIYELVWNDPSLGSENTVAVHIRHLREKIEIDPANPRYIKVVWGLGYKMEKI